MSFNVFEEECISEMEINKVEIANAFAQNYFPEDSEDLKKVLSCAWKKEGIMDKDGNIISEKFRRFLVENFRKAEGSNYIIAAMVAADTMHYCGNVQGNSPGETAVKLSNCVLRRVDSYS